jgi:hypothetical protein
MARQSLREDSQISTPLMGHSRHGLFLTRLMDCQSNAKPSKKDHDLPGIRIRDLWISSQHTKPLHHLGRQFTCRCGCKKAEN